MPPPGRSTGDLRPLKITAVGDGTVGKTCLLVSYTAGSFPTEYVPTIFNNYSKMLTVDGVEFSITLWDTAGQEDFAKLLPLSFTKTDCFILCYAIDHRASFENVELKWIDLLRHHCPNAAILLLGTKSDRISEVQNPVTEKEGQKLKSKIKATSFMHCSAKTNDNVEEVFIECVRAVMRQKNRGNSCPCI